MLITVRDNNFGSKLEWSLFLFCATQITRIKELPLFERSELSERDIFFSVVSQIAVIGEMEILNV